MTPVDVHPVIIQGGMGVGVSGWQLASAVARTGQLGVVSGTAVDTTLIRRLQDGDADGHIRRAMAAFPIDGVAANALRRYFVDGGRVYGEPYRLATIYSHNPDVQRQQLTVLASFVEVFLAKEGHTGKVGINLLTKLQLPNLALLYGAMLAGVDYVLMGAGIPRQIPDALDALATHEPASLTFDVEGNSGSDRPTIVFNPRAIGIEQMPKLHRPKFLAIVASHTLAVSLARKTTSRIDGFIIEGPTAGGHNAPPRGATAYNDAGEPIYGERDVVDLQQVRELRLPFWLAGGTGTPDQLAHALSEGAAGIQVGTLFAYCDESGFDRTLKANTLQAVQRGDVHVFTDPRASPTGFPFKLVEVGHSSHNSVRERLCDLGYLRTAYRRDDARIGYRCPAEPVADFVRKGGKAEDTVGRQCICNGLVAAIGLPQRRRDGSTERPLVTSGNALLAMGKFLQSRTSYSARDVVNFLQSTQTTED